MNKVLLKKINLSWTVKELINQLRIEKILEPGAFIDGSQCVIMVIK